MIDWSDFKTELENVFQYIDKELYLHRHPVKLHQMHNTADYTRTSYTIILELGTCTPDCKAQAFQYIEGLKDNVKSQVYL